MKRQGNRIIDSGINWVWFYTDSREDAEKWFEEITGEEPYYDWVISDPVIRDNPGRYDDMYSFRLHRDDDVHDYIRSFDNANEAINSSSIGHFKRSSIDLLDDIVDVDETSFYNDDDCSDKAEYLVEEPEDEFFDEEEEIDTSDIVEVDDEEVNEIDNTDEENIDSKDSTNPMDDVQHRKAKSNLISI